MGGSDVLCLGDHGDHGGLGGLGDLGVRPGCELYTDRRPQALLILTTGAAGVTEPSTDDAHAPGPW